jgi:hypothetical protein
LLARCAYFFSGTAAVAASPVLAASAGFASSAGLGVSGAATGAGDPAAGAGAGEAAGAAGAVASSFFPHADNATASMAAIRNEFFIAVFLLI